MDSGVETGNDSNDSLVTQHDQIIAITSPAGAFSQIQTHNLNNPINANSSSIVNLDKNLHSLMHVNDTLSSDSLSEEIVSNESEKSSASSTSLLSVSTFNSGPFFSLALVPAENKAKISTPNMTIEFRIPPLYSTSDYSLPAPLDFKQPARKCTHKWRPLGSRSFVRESQEWIKLKGTRGERKMRLAAGTNNIEMVKQLLKEGISPNNYDEQAHRSPLHLAASRGYTEMVSLLLAHGADPNQRDSIGNTPLHLAAVTGKISIVTLLLMAGTDVLSSDCHGNNPLQLAQTKLRLLRRCRSNDANSIKDEVRNVIKMLLVYLQKQKDATEQIEALSSFCSKLSLSNTTDQVQDDVRNLLANIDSLSLNN